MHDCSVKCRKQSTIAAFPFSTKKTQILEHNGFVQTDLQVKYNECITKSPINHQSEMAVLTNGIKTVNTVLLDGDYDATHVRVIGICKYRIESDIKNLHC